MAHINDLVNVLEGIDDKDPEWKNPYFVKSLKHAIGYGFRMKDADIVLLKWKMIGTEYERPDNQDALHMSKIDYQSAKIFVWILDQQEKMRIKEDALARTAEVSKEEYFGRIARAGSIQSRYEHE